MHVRKRTENSRLWVKLHPFEAKSSRRRSFGPVSLLSARLDAVGRSQVLESRSRAVTVSLTLNCSIIMT